MNTSKEVAITIKKTVQALLDFSYVPEGSTMPLMRIDEVEITVAPIGTECSHRETICPDCAEQWQAGLVLTERLPWELTK
ncbi:hypothetical protein [Nocardia arthritidis]|uniref:Uncharacterized protein n=1 Tax=Nocardia arthritidis TaxID=228602 RepID=A0A6G9Y9F2_9NOCA|nr:hypothetical protein [Nocardia arthritidis]QIS09852.1 hypothetical protein F5544_09760 [Nocardia arthritidis]